MAKILFLPHEGQGLGHLTRMCNAANALARNEHRCIIFTGDAHVTNFLSEGVDFVKPPSLDRISPARSKTLGTRLLARPREEAVAANRRVTFNALCDLFEPDIFISDQLPLGTRGEAADFVKNAKSKKYYVARAVIGAIETSASDLLRFDAKQLLETKFDRVIIAADERTSTTAQELTQYVDVSKKISHIGYILPDDLEQNHAEIRARYYAKRRRPWVVCSFGSGFGYCAQIRQCLQAAIDMDDVFFDIICGPRAPRSEVTQGDPLPPNARLHQFHPALSDLHFAADVSVTHGGSTMLEAIAGGSRIVFYAKRSTPRSVSEIERALHAAKVGTLEPIETIEDRRDLSAAIRTQIECGRRDGAAAVNLFGAATLSRIVDTDMAERSGVRQTIDVL